MYHAFAEIIIAFIVLQIGWYNDQVGDPFRFDLNYDTLAMIVISTPSMFEKTFLPFLKSNNCCERDPIDECTRRQLDSLKEVRYSFYSRNLPALRTCWVTCLYIKSNAWYIHVHVCSTLHDCTSMYVYLYACRCTLHT